MSSDYDAMRSMETRMKLIEDQNKKLVETMTANTAALEEFIDLGKALKFGLKIAGYLERIAVFFTKIAAAGAVAWATWKFLVKEAISATFKGF